MTSPRIAIIGGGIAGITAAYELRKLMGRKANLLILEAYDRLGGKLKTVDFATGPVDIGAEAYLSSRKDFTKLIEEIGLGPKLQVPSGLPSGLYVEGTLVDMPKNTVMGIPGDGDSVRGVLGEVSAARVDAERTGKPMPWTPGQNTTVGQLVGSRLGRAVVDQLVSPMLGGVYSCTADDLGVRESIPQLAEALDRHGADDVEFFLLDVINEMIEQRKVTQAASGGTDRAPIFRAVEGGYAAIMDALLDKAEAEIQYNSAVESIYRRGSGWYAEPIGEFDAIVIATPATTASVLLEDVAPRAAELLGQVELASSAVVGMRFASAHGLPNRSGVLLPENAPTEAKAFTFCTQKWPHLTAGGGVIVRASFGTLRNPWYLEVDNRALMSYALEDLQKVTGERKEPLEYFVQRWWGGLPCYSPGHLARMQEVLKEIESIPGLAIAGSMLNGVGVPATAETGIAAARSIAG